MTARGSRLKRTAWGKLALNNSRGKWQRILLQLSDRLVGRLRCLAHGIIMAETWIRTEKRLDELDYAGLALKPTESARRTEGFYSVFGATDGPLTPDLIASLLSSIRPEHGYGLLAPLPLPDFPYFPRRPDGPIPTQKSERAFSIFGKPPSRDPPGFDPAIIVKEERLKEKTAAKRKEFEKHFQDIKAQLHAVQEQCAANDYDAVRFLINLSHARQPLPSILRKSWNIDIDKESRILLCTFEILDFSQLNIAQKAGAVLECEVQSGGRRRTKTFNRDANLFAVSSGCLLGGKIGPRKLVRYYRCERDTKME